MVGKRNWRLTMALAMAAAGLTTTASGAAAQDVAVSLIDGGETVTAEVALADGRSMLVGVAREDLSELDALFGGGTHGTGQMGPQRVSLAEDVRIVEENDKVYITKGEAIKLELIFQALNVLDWATTKYCLDKGTCKEGNDFWGEDPDMTRMALIKLAVGGLHAAFGAFLYNYRPDLVKPYQYVSIGIYGSVVAWNLQYAF